MRNTGLIVCQVCLEDFQTSINCKNVLTCHLRVALLLFLDLSEPADVYSDWIDACEAANN